MAHQESSPDGAGVGVVDDPDTDPHIGTRFDAYELVARIGAGKVGVVYRAEHHLLGWQRALKLLPACPDDDSNDAYVERFARAVGHAAGLRHANIVQIHDIGVDERGGYLFMELLDGPTLSDLLQETPRLPLTRCITLLGQLCGALDYAHDANVAHLDITPANIIVRPGDHPMLLDFGIARLFHPTDPSAAGAVVGTRAYGAPEAIEESGDAFAADQYALGALAYELIVGRAPFEDEDLRSPMEASERRLPPAPREIRPELPEAVDQVLLRQLANEPDERYATATEFVVALRSALETRPARIDGATLRITAPRPPDPWTSLQVELQEQHRSRQDQPSQARLPRRRFLATVGTLVAGTGLTAGGLAVWSRGVGSAVADTTSGAETPHQDRLPAIDLSVPKLPVLSAAVAAPAPPATRISVPVTVGLSPDSTLTQGLRMDAMSYYQNAAGNIVMQGILANPTGDAASIDSFQLAFLNDAGVVVQTAKVTTGPLFVQPNARAPWMQMAGRDLPAFTAIRGVIRATRGTGPTSRTQHFDISDQVTAGSTGSDGTWSIAGRVTNRAKTPANSVSILAAAFGVEGKLLRVGSAFAAITRLAPGESSLFKVTTDAPADIERYELLVQGT